MTQFSETQYFRQPWLLAGLAAMMAPFWYGVIRQTILGIPFGDRPLSDTALILITASVTLTSLWLFQMHLRTEVRDNEVWVKFVLLWRPRNIPFEDILSAESVTYRPIRDYGGWGIRAGPKGKAYNVSGDRGVQLELRGGEHFLIGSQLPGELAQAISECKSLSASAQA